MYNRHLGSHQLDRSATITASAHMRKSVIVVVLPLLLIVCGAQTRPTTATSPAMAAEEKIELCHAGLIKLASFAKHIKFPRPSGPARSVMHVTHGLAKLREQFWGPCQGSQGGSSSGTCCLLTPCARRK